MRFTTQGKSWLQGLPFGNGRLAAMLWGDDRTDRITLNHERLWTGQHKNKHVEKAASRLPMLRELIESGDTFAATAFGNLFWGGKGGISGVKNSMDDYVPAGELRICYAETQFADRRLDMTNGAVYTRRMNNGGEIVARYYADCNGGGYAFSAQSAAPFCVELAYGREKDERLSDESLSYACDGLSYAAKYQGGTSFAVRFALQTDGAKFWDENGITVRNATYLHLSGDCTVNGEGGNAVRPFAESDFSAHADTFSDYMKRVELDVGEDAESDTGNLIGRAKESGKLTPALTKLYFDYGRYLFVSGSVCAEMPLNLQGKWNDSVKPAWNCDYHLNINLQMNYWAAEKIGLGELTAPLKAYVMRLAENGKTTARDLYGCRGFVLSHSADEWAHAVPQAYGWAVWVSAAGWLGAHLVQHYSYTRDREYLREVYPYLRGVAEFYEDFAVRDENGVLQLMPSQSPENRYGTLGHFPVALCRSSAIDVQICAWSLCAAADAAEILQVDRADREKWRDMARRLPPFRIGTDGRLLEWEREQVESEPGHRHLSHLYGAYPCDLFSREKRADCFEAAMRSLDCRIVSGGGQTGWSAAWAAALYAHAGNAEKCFEILRRLILNCTTDTLLDLHPPQIFQIDGNLGGIDAITEALASVHNGVVYLGSAVRAVSPRGRARGIRIPCGHEVSLSWDEHGVQDASVTFARSDEVTFVMQKKRVTLSGQRGESKKIITCCQ